MAGSKETTRQKMINLMYLVFIAMLALNISKEVLGTLGILSEDIENSITQINKQISSSYKKIEDNKSQPRYFSANEEKENLKKVTDDFYNYLDGIKDMLKEDGEGKTKKDYLKTIKITGDRDSIITNYAVMDKSKDLDDYFFSKPITSKNNANNNGDVFIQYYSSFEEKIITILDSINEKNLRIGEKKFEFDIVKTGLKKRFPFSSDGKVINDDGKKQAYLRYHFEGFPLIASLSKITNMQSNIRLIENLILTQILGGIAGSEGDLDNYKTNLYSDRQSYYTNNNVDAKIVLGRNDDNFKPDSVFLEVDGVRLKDNEYRIENGGVKLNRSWNRPKTYNLTGKLYFKQDDKQKIVDVDQKFTVIEAPNNPIVSPTGLRVFYVGLRNEVEVSFPGTDETTIKLSTQQGDIRTENGITRIIPDENKIGKKKIKDEVATMLINVSAMGDEGRVSKSLEFRVLNGPDAKGQINVRSGGVVSNYDSGKVISKNELIYGRIRGIKPTGFPYNYDIEVNSFEIKVGNLPTTRVNGNRVVNNSEVVKDINAASSGATVIITVGNNATKNDGGFLSEQYVETFFVTLE